MAMLFSRSVEVGTDRKEHFHAKCAVYSIIQVWIEELLAGFHFLACLPDVLLVFFKENDSALKI